MEWEWEWWRIVAAVVLMWLLLGALATIIPQCSGGMRQRLVVLNRIGRTRAIARVGRWRRYHERHGSYLSLSETDSAHLGWAYVMLVVSGPWSFAVLWSISRVKIPGGPAG